MLEQALPLPVPPPASRRPTPMPPPASCTHYFADGCGIVVVVIIIIVTIGITTIVVVGIVTIVTTIMCRYTQIIKDAFDSDVSFTARLDKAAHVFINDNQATQNAAKRGKGKRDGNNQAAQESSRLLAKFCDEIFRDKKTDVSANSKDACWRAGIPPAACGHRLDDAGINPSLSCWGGLHSIWCQCLLICTHYLMTSCVSTTARDHPNNVG